MFFFCWELRRGDVVRGRARVDLSSKVRNAVLGPAWSPANVRYLGRKKNGALPNVPGAEPRRLSHRRVVGRLRCNAAMGTGTRATVLRSWAARLAISTDQIRLWLMSAKPG